MVSSIQDQSILKSVQNGLQILSLFSREKSTWGTMEIARELSSPKVQ